MVNHLIEGNEEEIQQNMYWRQALDVRTLELSVSHTAPSPDNPRHALTFTLV